MVHPVCCQQRKVLDGSLRRHRLITPIAGEMQRRERGFLDLLVRASQFLTSASIVGICPQLTIKNLAAHLLQTREQRPQRIKLVLTKCMCYHRLGLLP